MLGKQHVVEQNDVDVGRPVVEPTVAHGQAQGYAAGQNFRLGKAARFHAHLTVAFRHPQRFQQAFPIFRRTVRHIQPMFGHWASSPGERGGSGVYGTRSAPEQAALRGVSDEEW